MLLQNVTNVDSQTVIKQLQTSMAVFCSLFLVTSVIYLAVKKPIETCMKKRKELKKKLTEGKVKQLVTIENQPEVRESQPNAAQEEPPKPKFEPLLDFDVLKTEGNPVIEQKPKLEGKPVIEQKPKLEEKPKQAWKVKELSDSAS